MVCLTSRIFNSGENIFSLQEGIVRQNFFIGSPGCEEIQYVGNTQAKAANAGAASDFPSSTVILFSRSLLMNLKSTMV